MNLRLECQELKPYHEANEHGPHQKIRGIYSRADIIVFPSWVEGWGMPPMEAAACKTAIVSTNLGVVKDYSHPEGAVFVSIRSVEGIVREVSELLNNPQKLNVMKDKNYDYIQQYTWKKTADQFEEIIKKE